MNEEKIAAYYSLTEPQKRVWYKEKIYNDPSMWNIGGALKVEGKLDFEILEYIINKLIENNDTLRLKFIENSGVLTQYFTPYKKIRIDKLYFRDEILYEKWAEENFKVGFSIKDEMHFYFALCNIDDNVIYIYLKMHHIIADGWSFAVIANQICDLYNKITNEHIMDNSIMPSYSNFIKREKDYLSSGKFYKDKIYWSDRYKQLPEFLYSEKNDEIIAERKKIKINKKTCLDIKDFTTNHQCSLNTFFIAVYLIYRYKMYDQKEIIIGSPNYNRLSKREKSTLGMFTSTIPVRFTLDDTMSISKLIYCINNELYSAFRHQEYPYNLLVQDLRLSQLGYDSLFETSINYYNTNFALTINGIDVETLEYFNGHQSYPIQIVIKEWANSGEIDLYFDYKIKGYKEEISFLSKYINQIIEEILNTSKQTIKDIQLISQEEINKSLFKLNNTQFDYPKNKTFIQLFEEQVLKTPSRIALDFNDKKLTYRELNEKSNQLARKIISKGIGINSRVGIIVSHSLELIISIIATIKAGGTYVPIDNSYPTERINYIINDSGINLILTNNKLKESIYYRGASINLDNENLYYEDAFNLNISPSSKDIAYIIYTSGSTGKPKGVMITHRNLVNYICWARKMYISTIDETFALYSSISFDLTVTSIFTPLINGNKIKIYHDDYSEFILYKVLRENEVDIVKLTPAHLSLIKALNNSNSKIKKLIVGGENLKTSLAAAIYESFLGNITIYNEYGPTETTVGCMIYRYDYEKDKNNSVPIGHMADNTQGYILDNDNQIVPNGKIGQLYIGGDGVSNGYNNNIYLTEKSFIRNPFNKKQIVYKTGDLVRYTANDEIEYIGRADRQVKIRGHRIELEEIEVEINKIDGVKESVVLDYMAYDDQIKLVAYVITDREISLKEIRNTISKFLPTYMLPQTIQFLEVLPLTANGKLDINKLPPINENEKELEINYETGTNENEKKLIEVLGDVLKNNTINLKDNFYELGGDSIKAIQVSSKLAEIGLQLRIKDLLEASDIREMAEYIGLTLEQTEINQGLYEGKIEKTPIMQWFLSEKFEAYNHWNQSILLKFKIDIHKEMVEEVIDCIINHHDVLRMNYDAQNDYFKYGKKDKDISKMVYEIDLSRLNKNSKKEQMINLSRTLKSSFNIENGSLLKACIFNLGNEERYLLIVAHHLIIDGVSWRILLEDLSSLLKQQINHVKLQLSKKTNSIQDWTCLLQKYIPSIPINEIKYWENITNNIALHKMDYDLGNDNFDSAIILKREFTHNQTQLLLTSSNEAYNTKPNDLLITALSLALCKITLQNKVTIELESHGREEIGENINLGRTVGWFTSMYPVNLIINEDYDLGLCIKTIKEQLRSIPKNGFNYGVLKYLTDNLSQKIYKLVRFNYLGDFDNSLNNNLFEFVNENVAEDISIYNHMSFLIEIVAKVINGKLDLTLTYSANKFKRESMENLINEFESYITKVLIYCCEKEKREFTPSDFSSSNLSNEDLENLFF